MRFAAGKESTAEKQLGRWPGFLRSKGFYIQLIALAVLLFAVHYFYSNTVANLTRQHIASGFGFLDMRAGITIPDSLIPYNIDSPYKTALLAGFVNTVFMSVLCIIAATALGFAVAFGRLSQNWLLSRLCLAYVEIFRNIPVLLVILFVYFAVLQQYLPPVRNSLILPGDIYINQRGIYFPALVWHGGIWASGGFAWPCLAVILAVLFCLGRRFFAQTGRGKAGRILCRAAAVILVLGALYALARGFSFNLPQKGRFNIQGGGSTSPEFMALFLGLSLYTAALISETVRAGILGVDEELKQAGASLGMRRGQIARFITLPMALRIIVPPLSGQYMNAAKNTSLAVAIGYSDLMRVGNTVLIQTNQSVEVVLIWIIAYLAICLLISALMNGLNYRLLYTERRG